MAKKRRRRKKNSKNNRKKSKKKFNTNFGKAVGRDVERRENERKGYGYLQLPKGMPTFSADPKTRVYLDFIPYVVQDENHPDKIEEEGIAVPGELWYKRPFAIHRNIGVEKDTVVCLRSIGKRCPICEYRDNRLDQGANWDDDEIKSMKPSDRNLYIVIPRKNGDYDEVPHIWDMSDFLFQELLDTELMEDEDYHSFPDLENGKTLKIRFDQDQIGKNKYAVTSRIDFKDRKRSYDEEILDEIPSLDEVLKILSEEELEAKFMEIDQEDYVDDEFEEEDEFYEEEEEDFYEDGDEPWEEDEEFEEEFEDDEEFFEEEDEEWEEEEEFFDEEEEFEESEPEPEPEKPKRTRKSKSKKRKRKRKRKKRS